MAKLTQKLALAVSQGERVVTVKQGSTPTLMLDTLSEVPRTVAEVLNFIAAGCLSVRVFLQPMRTVNEFNQVDEAFIGLLFKVPRNGDIRVSTIPETRDERSPETNVAEGSARILTISVDHSGVFDC